MTTTSIETDSSATTTEEGKRSRKPSKLINYLLLFLMTMLGGLAVLFFGHRINAIYDFDIAFVRAASPSEGRLYDLDQETNIITSRLLSIQPDKGRKFHLIEVTDDPDQVYEKTPPSPLDYAVMLHTLHERGVQNIILTTQMSWDGDLGITADALSDKLSAFDRATISLPLTRGATTQELPDILRRSIIPFSNIKGNRKLIPVVNQVALPAVISGGENTYAGFSNIESEAEDGYTIPMICLWQDEGIIPSLELLALMNAHNVSPDQILIHCGEHIRLGLEGPIIPIGDYGDVNNWKNDDTLSAVSSTKAEELIVQSVGKKNTTMKNERIYLIHANGEKTKATNALSRNRVSAVLHWSEMLPCPASGQSVQYRRLPVWAEIIIIFDIALAAWWFAGLSRGSRHLAFALTAALIFPLLLSIMDVTQHWMSVSSSLAAVIIAWLIPVKRRRHTTNIQAYHTTDPKPVIRA